MKKFNQICEILANAIEKIIIYGAIIAIGCWASYFYRKQIVKDAIIEMQGVNP